MWQFRVIGEPRENPTAPVDRPDFLTFDLIPIMHQSISFVVFSGIAFECNDASMRCAARKRKITDASREGIMAVISPSLHHVTMRTSHLDEMIAWYGAVVGARVMFRDQYAAWTTNDEANHRIAFLAVPGLSDDPQKIAHNGMHHCAFEYKSFDDLMASWMRLKDLGMAPAFSLDHGLTISIYYQDPEGNYVELQSDCFGDWKLSSEWIRTSEDFAKNPIGTFFNPEKVYEAHRSGVDFETLHKAMRAGEYLPDPIPGIGLPG